MSITDNQWFRAVNDLVHDLMAGVAPGAALTLWLVRSGAAATQAPEVVASMTRGWGWILAIIFGALALLVVTGAIRLGYHGGSISAEFKSAHGRSALVKHAAFAAVFVVATVVAFMVIQA